MCVNIIADSPLNSKPPATDALPCPTCGAGMTFASAQRRLACPACGLLLWCSGAEAAEIAGTLAGIYEVPLPQLLHVLAAAQTAPDSPEEGAPPESDADVAERWFWAPLPAPRLPSNEAAATFEEWFWGQPPPLAPAVPPAEPGTRVLCGVAA